MDYSKLSDSDLKALYNNDYESISDEGLKLLNGENTQNETKKGIDLTPSGLLDKVSNAGAAAVLTPVQMIADRNINPIESYKNAYNDVAQATEKAKASTPVMSGIKDFATDLAGYAALPVLRGGGVANFVGNAAIQGGVPGALESLKRGGNVASGAGVGSGIAAALQGIPYAGKLLKKPAEYLGKKAVESLTSLKPATIEQLVKPTSQALDLTEGSAQQLLANTTERVRDAYNNLLGKRGEAVREAASKLNDNASRVNADDLVQDIVATFDQYGGDLVNPARNMAGGLEKELIDLVNSGKPVVEIDTSLLPSGIMNKNAYNKALRKAYKENVRGKTVNHPQQGDIYMRKYGANETINKVGNDYEQLSLLPQIDEITENSVFTGVEPLVPGKTNRIKAENYDVYRGRANLHGNDVDTQIKVANTPQGKMFYLNEKPTDGVSGFTPNIGQPGDINGSINSITDINEFFNSLSPNDLQKVKEQIGKMAKWGDETSRTYAEPITRQIYNKFNQRLSDLSPELAQANAEYAALRNFQNNEGLKRILKPGDNIDTASSVLRNYNSTITKGNAGRNIHELEDVLVKNGEQPFLNVIDDINAANDLLKNIETGRNWLGATTLAKGLAKPVLKAVREANRNGISQKIQNIKDMIAPIGKLLPALGAKGAANMLYGGVEYNDYR